MVETNGYNSLEGQLTLHNRCADKVALDLRKGLMPVSDVAKKAIGKTNVSPKLAMYFVLTARLKTPHVWKVMNLRPRRLSLLMKSRKTNRRPGNSFGFDPDRQFIFRRLEWLSCKER